MVRFGRIRSDSVAFGRILIYGKMVVLGRIRPDFVKLGWIWLDQISLDLVGLDLVGFGWIRSDLVGVCRIWLDLVTFVQIRLHCRRSFCVLYHFSLSKLIPVVCSLELLQREFENGFLS